MTAPIVTVTEKTEVQGRKRILTRTTVTTSIEIRNGKRYTRVDTQTFRLEIG